MSQEQNSYVLEPKEEEKFYPSKVRKIVQEIMDDKVRNHVYEPNNTLALCEDLTRLIRAKIRTDIKMPRYKVAVQVCIGEMKGQGIKIASKCLWDPVLDNYASYQIQTEKLYAVAMVFGTYYE